MLLKTIALNVPSREEDTPHLHYNPPSESQGMELHLNPDSLSQLLLASNCLSRESHLDSTSNNSNEAEEIVCVEIFSSKLQFLWV